MDLIFFVLVIAALGVTAKKTTTPPPPPETCEAVGYQCSEDCGTILYCPEGQGNSIVIGTCKDHGKYCDADSVSCTDKPCKRDRPFLCTSANSFPDPYDCSKAYFCPKAHVPPEYQCQCPDNTYYDSQTGDCVSSGCPRKGEPECTNIGETKPFKTDPRYYYICNEKRVYIFKCPDASTFDGTECKATGGTVVRVNSFTLKNSSRWECTAYVDNSNSTNGNEPGKPPGFSTTTPAPPKPIGKCQYYSEILPDEKCDSYWICDRGLVPKRKTCPKGYHYDKRLKGCDRGAC